MPSVTTLTARVRKDDHLLRQYFDNIKESDRPYEIRRLLEKAIKEEAKEKELIEKLKNERKTEE